MLDLSAPELAAIIGGDSDNTPCAILHFQVGDLILCF
jgi:hypothetical protein